MGEEILVTMGEANCELLSGLVGKSLWSIGARQLIVDKEFIWGDSLCLFIADGECDGVWDPESSFVTFLAQDCDDSLVPGRVVTTLEVQQGIAASEIPVEQNIPGPCSSIQGEIRWFRIAEVALLRTTFAATGIGRPVADAREDGGVITIESGVRFTAVDGRSFTILAEQTGDLHFLRAPASEALLHSDETTTMIVRVGRTFGAAPSSGAADAK